MKKYPPSTKVAAASFGGVEMLQLSLEAAREQGAAQKIAMMSRIGANKTTLRTVIISCPLGTR
jgi:hypothetical protein